MAQHDALIIYHGAQGQSSDTNRPRTEVGKKELHTDQWQFDSFIPVKSLTVMGRSDVCGKQYELIIQMYAVVSRPHQNLHVVNHYQTRRTGVYWCALLIRSIAIKLYRLIHKTAYRTP